MHKRGKFMFKDKIMKHPLAKKLYKSNSNTDVEEALPVIIEARKWAGITQLQIAKKVNLCAKTISLIEKNDLYNPKYSPGIGSLMKYVSAFGFKLEIKFVPIK